MDNQKHPGGRPPYFTSVEDLQAKVDDYFKWCKGEPFLDDYGNQVFDKSGRPIILDKHPPTITGLALHLGFTNRQALLRYNEKAEFRDTITKAKARVERYAEERLYDRDGCRGAMFSLQNNFKGWNGDTERNSDALQRINDFLGGMKVADIVNKQNE